MDDAIPYLLSGIPAASDIWEELAPPRDDPQLRLWQDC